MTPPSILYHLSSNTVSNYIRTEKGKDGSVWIYQGSTSEFQMTEARIKDLMSVKLLTIEKPTLTSDEPLTP